MSVELAVILILILAIVGIAVFGIIGRSNLKEAQRLEGVLRGTLESVREELDLKQKKLDSLLEQNTKLTDSNTEFNEKNVQLTEDNYDLKTLNNEYVSFVRSVHSVLSEDIGFLQGELAQKLSLDIPEVKVLYQGLVRLMENIDHIKGIVEESERIKNE